MGGRFMIIKIIHAGICAGPIVFLVIAHLMAARNAPNDMYPYIGLFFCLASVPAAYMVPGILVREPRSPGTVIEKLARYQSGKIIQWALLEGASLTNAALYFIGGSWINTAAALLCAAVLVVSAPRLTEFRERFRVSEVEFRKFLD